MNEVNNQIQAVLKTVPKNTNPAPPPADYDETPLSEGLIFSPFGRYTVTDKGIYLTKLGKEGDDQTIKVTDQRLDVVAIGRTAQNEGYSILLKWIDIDGNEHKKIITKADLEGEAKDIRRMLADGGMALRSKAGNTDYLIDYLRCCKPARRFTLVDRLGWHKNKQGRYFFALKDKVIGSSDEEIIFNSSASDDALPSLEVSGTAQEWREYVANLCTYSSRGTLAVCMAFSAPMARILDVATFGIHLKGKTSRGKSTVAYLASSVYGQFSSYKKSWQGTQTGLEGLAYNYNDLLLILDEINNIDPKDLSNVVYSLGNEVDKNRGAKNGFNRATRTWREVILSTGEESVSNILKRANLKAQAGLEVRLPSINAQATEDEELGVNELFPPGMDAQKFKDLLEGNCRKYHGAVFEEWIKYLTAQDIEDLRGQFSEFRDNFIKEFRPTNQNRRIASNFALVAFAGELATKAGLTGWTLRYGLQSWARYAVGKCFKSALDILGNGMPIEDRRALEHIENLLTTKKANFLDGSKTYNFSPLTFWGYTKLKTTCMAPGNNLVSTTYYIFPTVFKSEFCIVMGEKETAQLLKKYGLLETEKDRLRKRINFENENSNKDDRKPYYAIKKFSTVEVIEKELLQQEENEEE